MKLNKTLIKEKANAIFERRWFLLVIAALGSFILAEQCSLSLFNNGTTGADSFVFQYVAYAMKNGDIPYRDIFDHKGPLLYLINFFGYSISPKIGIWLFELITIFVTVCFVYKTAAVICKNKPFCVAVTVICLAMIHENLEGGNLTEEYAMPFIAVGLYVFADYFNNGKSSFTKLLLCGFCGGCVLMLRPNMAVAWLIFPIFVFINEIREKRSKKLITYCIYFVGGVLVAILPFIIYYAAIGALGDLFDAYIIFNFEYSGTAGFGEIVRIMLYFATPLVFLSIGVLIISLFAAGKKLFNTAYLIYLLVSLWSLSISGNPFNHYALILIPSVSYPIALLFSKFKQDFFENATVLALIFAAFIGSWLPMGSNIVKNIASKPEANEAFNEVVEYVTENTDEDERILVFGNENRLYLACNRLSASKYSYQYPIANVRDDIREEFYDEINEENPAVIIIPHGFISYIDMLDFLVENNYLQAIYNESYVVYYK